MNESKKLELREYVDQINYYREEIKNPLWSAKLLMDSFSEELANHGYCSLEQARLIAARTEIQCAIIAEDFEETELFKQVGRNLAHLLVQLVKSVNDGKWSVAMAEVFAHQIQFKGV